MKLTENIRLKELTCRCGCAHHVFYETEIRVLAYMLQEIRDHFKKPIIVTSGMRCSRHNANVKGAASSYHMIGMAADFYIKGVNLHEVHEGVLDLMKNAKVLTGGVKKYNTFIHYDFRGIPVQF